MEQLYAGGHVFTEFEAMKFMCDVLKQGFLSVITSVEHSYSRHVESIPPADTDERNYSATKNFEVTPNTDVRARRGLTQTKCETPMNFPFHC